MSEKRRETERARAEGVSDPEIAALEEERTRLERRRASLSPLVEETLEGAISQSADDLAVIARFGPVRWPPVDFAFQEGGHVLVRSPRDAIVRLDDRLLTSDISLPEQDALEREVESLDDNISVIVARIGGVATYPAQVTPDTSLRGALSVASHEWVHHWLIFHSLGRAWFAGGELTSVNETVANIASEELSDRALELLTGEVVTREPWQPPRVGEPRLTPEPGVFDFRREMRQTRAHLEELLEGGRVTEAEAYLEERRLRFVEQGHNIRKLNTAWVRVPRDVRGRRGVDQPDRTAVAHDTRRLSGPRRVPGPRRRHRRGRRAGAPCAGGWLASIAVRGEPVEPRTAKWGRCRGGSRVARW